jgi:hypothetical protein
MGMHEVMNLGVMPATWTQSNNCSNGKVPVDNNEKENSECNEN